MSRAELAFTVVICTYSEARWDDLVRAVASVRNQSMPPCEIIVAIDHNPALLARVRSVMPDVLAVDNCRSKGLSGARNSANAAASGATIAFLDDDATAARNWLEQLAAGYEQKAVLGVGGAILPVWSGGRPRWFPEEFDWVVGCTYLGMPETTVPVRNLIGCNMSFRREVYDGLGGVREDVGRLGSTPLGCEETEFCIRARQRWPEGVLLYRPGAQVHHSVPRSRATWRYFGSRCYAEGLSKAQIAHYVGAKDSLASEWSYTRRTLPLGFVRNVAGSFQGRGDKLGRAGAIMIGLALTTTGYCCGKLFPATLGQRRDLTDGKREERTAAIV